MSCIINTDRRRVIDVFFDPAVQRHALRVDVSVLAEGEEEVGEPVIA